MRVPLRDEEIDEFFSDLFGFHALAGTKARLRKAVGQSVRIPKGGQPLPVGPQEFEDVVERETAP
ncbi:MAG: hypothetical protein ACXWG6_15720, partial [Usitatibacter sp.]